LCSGVRQHTLLFVLRALPLLALDLTLTLSLALAALLVPRLRGWPRRLGSNTLPLLGESCLTVSLHPEPLLGGQRGRRRLRRRLWRWSLPAHLSRQSLVSLLLAEATGI
jgi:hypothetical protein